jgi:hypothetical protein
MDKDDTDMDCENSTESEQKYNFGGINKKRDVNKLRINNNNDFNQGFIKKLKI